MNHHFLCLKLFGFPGKVMDNKEILRMCATSVPTIHQTGPVIPETKVTVAQQTPHPEMKGMFPRD